MGVMEDVIDNADEESKKFAEKQKLKAEEPKEMKEEPTEEPK